MKFLLKQIHKHDHLFQKGGKLERLHPLWEAQNTFLFTPPLKTRSGPHVRDSIDLKRLMITVVVALIPATLFGIYNTGYQQLLA
ncbi:MAG: RnfABCDGE type electron transport complex subunit D, partial [Leptospiraceae bacterium]|nr:RnfABCDGE type electron transport complex subunit D [Leptospiraceae bacterium]